MANSLERVWSKQGIESILLSPLGALYALGWWSYQSIYTLRLKKPFEPHAPVVTVGNLIAGGAGKTPTSLYIAEVLRRLGHTVYLSMSGYGFPHAQDATLAPSGSLDASEWGDEPAMVRDMAPDIPLVVGRDRVMAAQIVHRTDPSAVMLMDDGFQHLRLRQHVTILLDQAGPNRFCLPAGPFREPRSTGRSRADLILPSAKFSLHRSPTRTVQVRGTEIPLNRVNVVCALARPQRLLDGLRANGLTLDQVRTLPDHDPLTAGTLFDGLDQNTALVVTAKDWTKLKHRQDLGERPVFVADYVVKIEPEAEFEAWLRVRLDEFC